MVLPSPPLCGCCCFSSPPLLECCCCHPSSSGAALFWLVLWSHPPLVWCCFSPSWVVLPSPPSFFFKVERDDVEWRNPPVVVKPCRNPNSRTERQPNPQYNSPWLAPLASLTLNTPNPKDSETKPSLPVRTLSNRDGRAVRLHPGFFP